MSSHTPPSDETQVSVHDTAKIKLLKFIVAFLGVLMVIAFLTVIGTIAYRIMTKGDAPETPSVQQVDEGSPMNPTPSVSAIANVTRPAGSALISVEVEGQLVYLHFSHKDDGDSVFVVDQNSGKVVRQIIIK